MSPEQLSRSRCSSADSPHSHPPGGSSQQITCRYALSNASSAVKPAFARRVRTDRNQSHRPLTRAVSSRGSSTRTRFVETPALPTRVKPPSPLPTPERKRCSTWNNTTMPQPSLRHHLGFRTVCSLQLLRGTLGVPSRGPPLVRSTFSPRASFSTVAHHLHPPSCHALAQRSHSVRMTIAGSRQARAHTPRAHVHR